MPFVDDEVVKALLSDRTYPAFRISVGVRSTNRHMDNFDVLRCEHLIEGGSKLRVMIMEETVEGWRLLFPSPAKLAGLLSHPLGGWMLSATSDVDAARVQFNQEVDIDGFQPQGFDGEKVAG